MEILSCLGNSSHEIIEKTLGIFKYKIIEIEITIIHNLSTQAHKK